MATQKALWLPKIGAEFVLAKNEIPEPGPGEVLVKVEASALNPIDVVIQESGFYTVKGYPAVLGEEGAGVVENVGDGVTNLVRGDKVFFQTIFKNDYGSFQEYCLVIAELAAKAPPNLSFDQAASVAVGFNSFAVGTYAQQPEGMGLTPPFEKDGLGKYAGRPVVILGGSSSVGQNAIQLAKLSGFSPIITTASPHNEGFLRLLGATHIVDRTLSDTEIAQYIRQLADVPLTYIFDAISVKETQQVAYDLLAPGGTLNVVHDFLGDEVEGSDKKVLYVRGSFHFPRNRAIGAKFAVALTEWLEEGKIKPNHVEVIEGGLDGVATGLARLAAGVSATKLVVRPPETRNA